MLPLLVALLLTPNHAGYFIAVVLTGTVSPIQRKLGMNYRYNIVQPGVILSSGKDHQQDLEILRSFVLFLKANLTIKI